MAVSFNLTAEINLRGPSNLNQVVSQMRRQLSTVNLDLKINASTTKNINNLTSAVNNLNSALQSAQVSASSLSAALAQIGSSASNIGNIAGSLNNINTGLSNASASARSTSKNITQATNEMSEFGKQSALAIRRFAAFSVVTGAIYGLTRAISSAYSEFVKFDKEFVRLQQVTNSTASGLNSLSNEISKLSTSFGVGSEELLNVSVTLAQAGLSANQTKDALEALAKSALAPSFDDLNQTVEGSIALMRQFGISSSQLEDALGSINAVSAKFAVEASDIITAISRTGGVFASASKGVSEGTDALNEFIAIFTSVRQTTRESAETIATGLRTIFTRIQRGTTIQALEQFGVKLTDLEGKFVGPYEAVRRLSEGLSKLDTRDIRFSQIVEELGGFRQIGKVIPLIQQFSTAQQALAVAQRGSGSLTNDAAKAQESLAIRVTKVREEFVGLIREIGQTQSFQKFVDISLSLASALIGIASSAKEVLPALTAIAAIKLVPAISQFVGGFSRGIRRKNSGGIVRGFAGGGFVPGSGNRDTVPAMLTPGEFVIRKKAVEKIGTGRLNSLNKYATGGPVEASNLKSEKIKQRVKSAKSNIDPEKFKSGEYLTDTDLIYFDKTEYGLRAPKNIRFDTFEKEVGKRVGGKPLGGNVPIDIPKNKKNIPIEVRNRNKTTRDSELLDKLLRYNLSINNTLISNKKQKDNRLYAGKIGVAYNTSKIQRDRFTKLSSGGYIQKFMSGAMVKSLEDMIPSEVLNEAKKFGINVPYTTRDILRKRKNLSNADSLIKKTLLDQISAARISAQEEADRVSSIASTRSIGVVGITGDRLREEATIPGAIGKTGISTKDVPATLQTGTLPPALAKRVQARIRNSIERLIAQVGKEIAKAAGSTPTSGRSSIRSIASKDIEDLIGPIFEKSLGVANASYDPLAKSIDFPSGLKPELARLLGIDPGIMTDVTNKASIEKARDKLDQFGRGRVEARERFGRSQFANGGSIEKFADGGSPEDTVPALLTPGEFVINKKAASKIGRSRLNQLNKIDKISGFNKGGPVGYVQKFAAGGSVSNIEQVISRLFPTLVSALKSLERATLKKEFDIQKSLGKSNRESLILSREKIKENRAANISRLSTAATFLGPVIADQVGNAIKTSLGGKTGAAVGAGVSTVASYASVGFAAGGPWGAAAGAAIGLVAAFKSAKDAASDYVIAEQNRIVEIKSKNLEKTFEKLSRVEGLDRKSAGLQRSIGSDIGTVAVAQTTSAEEEISKNKVTSFGKFFGYQLDTQGLSQSIAEGNKVGAANASALIADAINRGQSTDDISKLFGDNLQQVKRSIAIQEGGQKVIDAIISSQTGNEQEKSSANRYLKMVEENYYKEFVNSEKTKNDALKRTVSVNNAVISATNGLIIKMRELEKSFAKASNEFSNSMIKINEQYEFESQPNTRMPSIDRTNEYILANPASYSRELVSSTIGNLGSATGIDPKTVQEMQKSFDLQRQISLGLPDILKQASEEQKNIGAETNTEDTNTYTKIRRMLGDQLKDMDPATLDSAAKEMADAILKKTGTGQTVSYDELIQDSGAFAQLMKSYTDSQSKAISLQKQYNDVLSQVDSSLEKFNESIIRAQEYTASAANIRSEAQLNLRSQRGENISLAEMNAPFENSIRSLTEQIGANNRPIAGTGTTDLKTIEQRLKRNDEELKKQVAKRDSAGNAGNRKEFEEASLAIARLKRESVGLDKALKELATNTIASSNALKKLQDLRSIQSGKQNLGIDILRNFNNPEWMMDLELQMNSLGRILSGTGNRLDIEPAFAALDRLRAIMSPEAFQKIQQQIVSQSGSIAQQAGLPKEIVDAIIESFDPSNPQIKAAEEEYLKAEERRAQANEVLAKRTETSGEVFYNKVKAAADLWFKDAADNTPQQGAPIPPVAPAAANAGTKSNGGVVYASKGRFVNFQPKGSDTIPAMLTPGEFVVNSKATAKNLPLLRSINNGDNLDNFNNVSYAENGGLILSAINTTKSGKTSQSIVDFNKYLKDLAAEIKRSKGTYDDATFGSLLAFNLDDISNGNITDNELKLFTNPITASKEKIDRALPGAIIKKNDSIDSLMSQYKPLSDSMDIYSGEDPSTSSKTESTAREKETKPTQSTQQPAAQPVLRTRSDIEKQIKEEQDRIDSIDKKRKERSDKYESSGQKKADEDNIRYHEKLRDNRAMESWMMDSAAGVAPNEVPQEAALRWARHNNGEIGAYEWDNLSPEEQQPYIDRYLPEFQKRWAKYQADKDAYYKSILEKDPGASASEGVIRVNFFNERRKVTAAQTDTSISLVERARRRADRNKSAQNYTEEEIKEQNDARSRQSEAERIKRDLDYVEKGEDSKGQIISSKGQIISYSDEARALAREAAYEELGIKPGTYASVGSDPSRTLTPDEQKYLDTVEKHKPAATEKVKQKAIERLQAQGVSISGVTPPQASQPATTQPVSGVGDLGNTREARKQAYLAEKEARRQAYLQTNPAARKAEEKKQEEIATAESYGLSVTRYRTARSRAQQFGISIREAADMSNEEARARAKTKEQARIMIKGADLAKRVGWTDDGSLFGSYTDSADTISVDQLSASEQQILSQYQEAVINSRKKDQEEQRAQQDNQRNELKAQIAERKAREEFWVSFYQRNLPREKEKEMAGFPTQEEAPLKEIPQPNQPDNTSQPYESSDFVKQARERMREQELKDQQARERGYKNDADMRGKLARQTFDEDRTIAIKDSNKRALEEEENKKKEMGTKHADILKQLFDEDPKFDVLRKQHLLVNLIKRRIDDKYEVYDAKILKNEPMVKDSVVDVMRHNFDRKRLDKVVLETENEYYDNMRKLDEMAEKNYNTRMQESKDLFVEQFLEGLDRSPILSAASAVPKAGFGALQAGIGSLGFLGGSILENIPGGDYGVNYVSKFGTSLKENSDSMIRQGGARILESGANLGDRLGLEGHAENEAYANAIIEQTTNELGSNAIGAYETDEATTLGNLMTPQNVVRGSLTTSQVLTEAAVDAAGIIPALKSVTGTAKKAARVARGATNPPVKPQTTPPVKSSGSSTIKTEKFVEGMDANGQPIYRERVITPEEHASRVSEAKKRVEQAKKEREVALEKIQQRQNKALEKSIEEAEAARAQPEVQAQDEPEIINFKQKRKELELKKQQASGKGTVNEPTKPSAATPVKPQTIPQVKPQTTPQVTEQPKPSAETPVKPQTTPQVTQQAKPSAKLSTEEIDEARRKLKEISARNWLVAPLNGNIEDMLHPPATSVDDMISYFGGKNKLSKAQLEQLEELRGNPSLIRAADLSVRNWGGYNTNSSKTGGFWDWNRRNSPWDIDRSIKLAEAGKPTIDNGEDLLKLEKKITEIRKHPEAIKALDKIKKQQMSAKDVVDTSAKPQVTEQPKPSVETPAKPRIKLSGSSLLDASVWKDLPISREASNYLANMPKDQIDAFKGIVQNANIDKQEKLLIDLIEKASSTKLKWNSDPEKAKEALSSISFPSTTDKNKIAAFYATSRNKNKSPEIHILRDNNRSEGVHELAHFASDQLANKMKMNYDELSKVIGQEKLNNFLDTEYDQLIQPLDSKYQSKYIRSADNGPSEFFSVLNQAANNPKTKDLFVNSKIAQEILSKLWAAHGYSSGGIVYASKGTLVPYKSRGTDTVPAMLTPGEFVVNRRATAKNLPLLKSINNGDSPQYRQNGGIIYRQTGSQGPESNIVTSDGSGGVSTIKLDTSGLDTAFNNFSTQVGTLKSVADSMASSSQLLGTAFSQLYLLDTGASKLSVAAISINTASDNFGKTIDSLNSTLSSVSASLAQIPKTISLNVNGSVPISITVDVNGGEGLDTNIKPFANQIYTNIENALKQALPGINLNINRS